MLGTWRRRRALRRARQKKDDEVRAAEVRVRIWSLIEEVVGPYVHNGSASIEKVDWDEIMGPEIRVTPAREGAAAMTVDPMVDWVSLAVGLGDLEIWVDSEGGWEEELSVYLRSVIAGRYREVGKGGTFTASTRMIFGQPEGGDLIAVVGGTYRGVERDHPPGERSYAAYEDDSD